MKRLAPLLIASLFMILAFSVGHTQVTHAFDINNPNPDTNTTPLCASGSDEASNSSYCGETTNPTNDLSGSDGVIIKIADIVSLIGGVAAVIMIIIGGFRFVISGGDSNQVSGAKNMIIYALVGIVIIASAQIIIRFVLGKL